MIKAAEATKGQFDEQLFRAFGQQIDEILDKGDYVLGPEATNLLVKTESEILSFLRLMSGTPPAAKTAGDLVYGVTSAVMELRHHLAARADRCISWEARNLELFGDS